MSIQNLFRQIPASLPEELVEVLARSGELRIERIVSRGHASPRGFWYQQPKREFVVLLSGSATLEFENGRASADLSPGDYTIIEARERHRVSRTAIDTDTVWLAIHYP